jgi:polyhydroxyalkanoate synthesis regulator phasin
MSRIDELRARAEAALGTLTPARAQELAKTLSDPSAAREQINKTAAELLEWSQRNRERITGGIRTEIARQLKAAGLVERKDFDALAKRVRALERMSRTPAKRRTTSSTTARKRASGGSGGAKSAVKGAASEDAS